MARNKLLTAESRSLLGEELARLVDAFEVGWERGHVPKLETYLTAAKSASAEMRCRLLLELSKIDLVCRHRAVQAISPIGDALTVQFRRSGDYAALFPELDTAAVDELIALESQLAIGEDAAAPAALTTAQFPTVTPNDTCPPLSSQNPQGTIDYQPGADATPQGAAERGGKPRSSPSFARKGGHDQFLSAQRFGEYELIAPIARGGMGVVYKARQIPLNRIVALKMILSGQLASDEEVRRFYAEAESAARLDHPHIVPIHEVGEYDGQHFFSMGFVEGPSLAARMREKPYAPRAAASLLREVALAVHYAHEHGIIHRDLKPSNILLDAAGEPRVTDFGLAKQIEGDSGLTASGEIMGTPNYMPPEQAMAQTAEIGPTADVYSLGAILYEMLVGRPPFRADNILDTLKQVLEQEPVSPRLLSPNVDRDLETICLKCLSKNRHERYATARELADELQRYLSGEPIRARRIGIVARGWRWCKRKPIVASLGGAVVVAAVSLLLAWSGARQAQRLHQLTNLNRRFDVGLEKPVLSSDYLDTMDTLIAAIETLDPPAGHAAHSRLNERWTRYLDESIRRPRLDAEDVKKMEEAIALLTPRDAAASAALREKLKKRVGDWQRVFELQPPFDNLAAVFAAEKVRVNGRSLQRAIPPVINRQILLEQRGDSGGSSVDLPQQVLRTNVASNGGVRLEAVFGKSWRDANRLGLVIDDGKQGGYSFLLTSVLRPIAKPAAGGNGPTKEYIPFEELPGQEVEVQLTVEKRGVVIRRHSLPLGKFSAGDLVIRVTREGDQLTFQLNDLPKTVIFDPFPLTVREGVYFAVDWPRGVEVRQIFAERKAAPPNPSPLQKADEFYDEGRFANAETLYAEQVQATTEEEIRREARCKRGLCLMELGRRDEAAEVLQALAAEPGDRWPVIAACQMWLFYLRREKNEEANAIFELLSSRYRFEQLAALLPHELRGEILKIYFADINNYDKVLRFRSDRIETIERATRIDRFLSFDGRGEANRQILLSRGYRFVGDTARAFEAAAIAARDFPDDFGCVRHYSRLLRQTGRLPEALQVCNDFVDRSVKRGVRARIDVGVERSRVFAAMEDWERTEDEVDSFLRLLSPIDKVGQITASLMKGFLLERRGSFAEAQQVWKETFVQHRGLLLNNKDMSVMTTPIELIILGSLTGELSSNEITAFQSLFTGAGAQNSFSASLAAGFNQQAVETACREMWRTPRGRAYAAAMEFESLGMADRARFPPALGLTTYIQQNLPGRDFSPAEEAALWDVGTTLIDKVMLTGELQPTQVVPLALTWKGTTNFLGWGGVSASLSPDVRGPVAYFFGLRFLKLNNPKQAAEFFSTAVKEAPPNSPLARIAGESQQLLRDGKGRLVFDNEYEEPVSLVVRQGEKVIATVAVKANSAKKTLSAVTPLSPVAFAHADDAEATFVDVPPGQYEIALASPRTHLGLSKKAVTVISVGRHFVSVNWRWKPDETDNASLGLVARPSRPQGIHRWQAFLKDPAAELSMAEFSPDGRWLATAGADGAVRLYDAESRKLTMILAEQVSYTSCLSWSPDSTKLVTGGSDRSVRIWERATGRVLRRIRLPKILKSVAWSPDGDRIATVWADSLIRIFDTNGALVQEINNPDSPLSTHIAWSPHGQQIAATGGPGETQVRVWRTLNGIPETTLRVPSKSLTCGRWSPDGKWFLVAQGAKRLSLWNTATWKEDFVFEELPAPITGITWLDNGRAATISGDDQLKLWDIANRKLGAVAGTRAASYPESVHWHPERGLVTAGRLGQVQLWNEALQPQGLMGAPKRKITAVAYAPPGDLLAVYYDGDRKLCLLDRSGHCEQAIPLDVEATSIAWRADGQQLAIPSAGNNIQIWNRDGTLATTLTGNSTRVYALAWRDDGVLASGSDDGMVRWWKDEKEIAKLPTIKKRVTTLAWSKEGWLAAGVADGKVFLWSQDGSVGPLITPNNGTNVRAAWHPRGDRFATSVNNVIGIWSREGNLLDSYKTTLGSTYDIAWSSKDRLATCFHEGRIGVFGQPLASTLKLLPHAGTPTFLAWSPNGDELVTAASVPVLQVWDGSTLKPTRTIALLPDGGSANFTAGGHWLDPTEETRAQIVFVVDTGTGPLRLMLADEFRSLVEPD